MMSTWLLRPTHLRRHGTSRLGMDVISPGHLRPQQRQHRGLRPRVKGHEDSLPPLIVLGRTKLCLGPARAGGTTGAQVTDVPGESGEMIMTRAISRSSGNGHAGTECRTGTMGAGAPPAVRLERNGIQPAECVVFVGPTDRK